MHTPFNYIGTELELFAAARNWKNYLATQVRPFLGPTVLEVGAGLGATTAALCTSHQTRWVCLEPDEAQATHIAQATRRGELPTCCEVIGKTLDTAGLAQFDSVIYIDVLEHIEDDRAELMRAARHLSPGGHLVVLSPAYPALYSAFDDAIGHFRRYTASALQSIAPSGLKLAQSRYLDCVGVISSAANKLFLRQRTPTAAQIDFWDRRIIPLSRHLDRVIGYHMGRSILMVWKAPRADVRSL
jgi:SAM-dependent methyltransferase